MNQQTSTQPYNKVICNCARCNGKLIERHTKALHEIDQYSDDDLGESSFGIESRHLPSFGDTLAKSQLTEDSEMDKLEMNESETEELEIEELEIGIPEEENDNDETSTSTDNDEDEFTFLSRQRLRMYKTRLANITEIEDSAAVDPFECTTEEDESTNTQDENEPFDNEYREIFEDYSYPDFDSFQNTNFTQPINDSWFLWILLWIMNF